MLKQNTGLEWREPVFDQIQAFDINETEEWDNPQQMRLIRMLKIEPTGTATQVLITDRVARVLQRVAWMQLGGLREDAIMRQMDVKILTALNGAGTVLGGAGSTFDIHKLEDIASLIADNPDEPGRGQIQCVAHGHQIRQITAFFTEGIGQAGMAGAWQNQSAFGSVQGLTERVLREGFQGRISGVNIHKDNHIEIDAQDDAVAKVFVREAMVRILSEIVEFEDERLPRRGYGATNMISRSMYALGGRRPDIWMYGLESDASKPS